MPPKRRKAGRPPGSKNKKTLLKHGRKIKVICDICEKSFDSKATLNQHQGLCKSMNTYDIKKAAFSCQECTKKFRFEDSYKMHLENEHSKSPGSLKCDLCPVTCPNKEALMKHIECYHERDKFNCPHCKKEFARQSHVLRHMSQKGCGGSISLYMCEICNCSFTRKDNLMAHLRLKHIAKDHFKCKQCAYHTKNFSKLIIHQQKSHLEKPLNFECDHCGKMTSSRAAIAKHLEIHGTRKYSCDVCGYSTFTQEVLRRHILTHVQEKPHKCAICKRSYIQRAQLQRHMIKHNGITCLVCGMSFTSKTGLMTHHKCHTEGKKLCCPFDNCSYGKKEFSNEANLQNHVKWHLEEKPYTCEVCSKRFHSERYMQKHMLTHTLERPRRCMYCVIARAYARGEQLVRHVRVSHPAIFRDHLTHVRQVLGLNVGTERVKKSELQSILNMLDAESDRILEGYGTGVLYGGLVENDGSISDSTSVNLKNEDGPLMSEEELAENLKKLLLQLIEKETLDIFGWPDEPVDSILEKVIEHCGAKAADREKWSRVQRLRENAKHLFVHAIEDKNITRMLDTHTIDQIIKHFLTQVDGDEEDHNEIAPAKV